MAKDFPIIVRPFLGLDEASGDKSIDLRALSSCDNVVLRESRIAPRPGYVAETPINFRNVIQIVNASLRTMGDFAIAIDEQRIYRTNQFGAVKSIAWFLRAKPATSTEITGTILTPTGIALDPDIANRHVYYVNSPQIRRVGFDGAGDVQLIADADNGAPGPITQLELRLNNATKYMFWATQLHVMRSLIDGSGSTAVVATGIPYSVCVRDTATGRIFWIDRNGAANRVLMAALDGSGVTLLYTAAAGRTLWHLCHNQQDPGRVYWTETGAGYGAIVTVSDAGGASAIIVEGLTAPLHIQYAGDRNELYFTMNAGGDYHGMYKVSAAVADDVIPVSGSVYERQLLGTDGAMNLRDIHLIQLRNMTAARTDYAMYFADKNLAYAVAIGYAQGQFEVPSVWAVNSRTARTKYNYPFEPGAGRACLLYQGEGVNSGRGGWLVLSGGVPACSVGDFSVPPAAPSTIQSLNEIQDIDIGAQSGGNFKLIFDYGITGDEGARTDLSGNIAHNVSAAALKLLFEAAYAGTPAEFAITNPSAGRYRIEWTGAFGNRSWPMLEIVNVNLTTPANIQPVDRIQEGRNVAIAAVDEVHKVSIGGHGAAGVTEPFHLHIIVDDAVVNTASISRNSNAAAVKALLASAYVEIDNIDVIVTGAGTLEWTALITYSRDYSGRTFNVPVIIFDNPGVWIDIGTHAENREAVGVGIEQVPALPANLGVGTVDTPSVINYVLGDTVQLVTFNTPGEICLQLDDFVTAPFLNTAGQAALKKILEVGFDYVCVHYDPTGNGIYTIRFSGSRSGKCVPLLRVKTPVYTPAEQDDHVYGTATVTTVQHGGTDTGSIIFARPSNLPFPVGIEVETTTQVVEGLHGTYSLRAYFVSDIWGLLGPLSPESVHIGVYNRAIRVRVAIPDLQYFDNSIPPDAPGGQFRQAINRLRIVRQKVGTYNLTNTIWRLRHNYHAGFIKFTITMPNGIDTGPMAFNDNAYDETGVDPSLMSSSEQDIVEAFALAGYEVIATRNSAQDADDDFNIEFVGNETGKLMGLPVSALAVTVLDVISGTGTTAWLEQMRRSYVQRGGVAVEPEPAGRSDTWYPVGEIDIDAANLGGWQEFIDTLPDAEFVSDELPPTTHGYPPRQANFAAMHEGAVHYLTGVPADNFLWSSKTALVGGRDDGKLGYEYCPPGSADNLANYKTTDTPFCGIRSFDRVLLIGSADDVIEGQVTSPDNPTPNAYRTLEGVRGFASHWMVAKLGKLRAPRPSLVWADADANVYEYVGGVAKLLTDLARKLGRSVVRKHWNRLTFFDALDSWYWSDTVVDESRNQVIFNLILNQGGFPRRQLILDMASREVTAWRVPAATVWPGRDLVDPNKAEKELFISQGGFIRKLADGKADAGVPFVWFVEFGWWTLAGPFVGTNLHSISLEFELTSFAGDPAQITVSIARDGGAFEVVPKMNNAVIPANGRIYSPVDRPCKRLKLRIEGTQSDNKTHPELIAIRVKISPEGYVDREGG